MDSLSCRLATTLIKQSVKVSWKTFPLYRRCEVLRERRVLSAPEVLCGHQVNVTCVALTFFSFDVKFCVDLDFCVVVASILCGGRL